MDQNATDAGTMDQVLHRLAVDLRTRAAALEAAASSTAHDEALDLEARMERVAEGHAAAIDFRQVAARLEECSEILRRHPDRP